MGVVVDSNLLLVVSLRASLASSFGEDSEVDFVCSGTLSAEEVRSCGAFVELTVIGGNSGSAAEDFSAFVVVNVFANSSMDITSGAGGAGCKAVGLGAFLASKLVSVMTLGFPTLLT